jgi:hypothetical protein
VPTRLAELGVVRSIAVEDPWPTNLYWRMLLADGRVVQAPVTIQELHLRGSHGLVEICARAVVEFCKRNGPVPKPTHEAGTPDLAATIVGYRAWKVASRAIGQEVGLRPLGGGADHWRGAEEVRARCGTMFHAAPDPSHHCGWNAWHDPLRVERELRRGRVVGAIACRGRVEVHRDGFRAEWARPICLAYHDDAQLRMEELDIDGRRFEYPAVGCVGLRGSPWSIARPYIEQLASRLGLPAVPFGQLEAFAREHGSPVPAGMRPAGSAV